MRERGKKIGVFHVTAKNEHRVLAEVPYRFDDSDGGTFYAKVEDETFKGPTLGEVKNAVFEHVRSRSAITWEPMIQVTVTGDDDSYGRGRDSDERAQAVGVRLAIAMVSRETFPHHYRKGDRQHLTMRAYVAEDGTPTAGISRAIDHWEESNDEKMLPWSPERWAALQAIRDSIRNAREKLLAIVADVSKVDEIAAKGSAGLLGPAEAA